MIKSFILVATVLVTFGLVTSGPVDAAVSMDQLQTDAGEKAEGCKCTCPKCNTPCDHKDGACTCPKCQAKCECQKTEGCDCPHRDCPHHKEKKKGGCPHKH